MKNLESLTSAEIGAHNIANLLCAKYVNELHCNLTGADSNEDIETINSVTEYYDMVFNEAFVKLTNYSGIKD